MIITDWLKQKRTASKASMKILVRISTFSRSLYRAVMMDSSPSAAMVSTPRIAWVIIAAAHASSSPVRLGDVI